MNTPVKNHMTDFMRLSELDNQIIEKFLERYNPNINIHILWLELKPILPKDRQNLVFLGRMLEYTVMKLEKICPDNIQQQYIEFLSSEERGIEIIDQLKNSGFSGEKILKYFEQDEYLTKLTYLI